MKNKMAFDNAHKKIFENSRSFASILVFHIECGSRPILNSQFL